MGLGFKKLTSLWNRKQLDEQNRMLEELYQGEGIPNKGIGEEQIKNESVGTDIIKKGAITEDKLDRASVSNEKLQTESVDNENLKNNSISIFKVLNGQLSSDNILESVTLKKCGKNLFNKEKITRGYYFDGNELSFKKTAAADCVIINVSNLAGTYLFQNSKNSYIIYDKNLNALKGHPTNQLIELPENAFFIGVTIFKGKEDTYQIEQGKVQTSYEKYVDFIDSDEFKNKSISKTKLIEEFLEPKIGKNLFDKSTVTKDVYISGENGKINILKGYCATDYIPVVEGNTYYKNDTQQLAYFKEKSLTSFVGGKANGNIFTIPNDVKYVRITIKESLIDTFQVEAGTTPTSYEAYGKYVTEELLAPSIVEKINTNQNTELFDVQLPSKIYITKDQHISIYWRNIIRNSNLFYKGGYSIRLQEKKGENYFEIGKNIGYQWFLTPDFIGEKQIEIRIFDNYSGEVIVAKNCTLISTSDLSTSVSKTIIELGDSFYDLYGISRYIHDFVSEDKNKNLNMIGLNDTGKEGVKDNAWAGYGYQWLHDLDRGYLRSDRPLSDAYWDAGWGENEVNGWKTGQTFSDLSAEQKKHGYTKNEFFNPSTKKFDFNYYMSEYMNNQKVDGVFIMYGLNDSVWKSPYILKAQLSIYKTRIDNIIKSIKLFDAEIKVSLSLVTPQQENDSFMNSRGNDWLTSEKAKISQEIWNQFILDNYDNRHDENIYVLATNASFDTRYGVLEGSYNPVKFQNDIVEKHARDVHPSETGAKQIADVVRNGINNIIFSK